MSAMAQKVLRLLKWFYGKHQDGVRAETSKKVRAETSKKVWEMGQNSRTE
jgi:hypothetical protein